LQRPTRVVTRLFSIYRSG